MQYDARSTCKLSLVFVSADVKIRLFEVLLGYYPHGSLYEWALYVVALIQGISTFDRQPVKKHGYTLSSLNNASATGSTSVPLPWPSIPQCLQSIPLLSGALSHLRIFNGGEPRPSSPSPPVHPPNRALITRIFACSATASNEPNRR